MEVLVHYLDAMGPFLKYFPDAAGSVINKLFELLTSLPLVIKVLSTNPFSLLLITIEKLSGKLKSFKICCLVG